MWQGIQAITSYRKTTPACDCDSSLPDTLNNFYAQFDAQNDVLVRKSSDPHNNQVLCLTSAHVGKTLRRVNPKKAAGPDNIPGRLLREYADQLTDVLTDIVNLSLRCLKATTMVPVPKKSPVSCLNGYHPIAVTPIMMKCFENLIMRRIKTLLLPTLDPLQFACHHHDAIATTLHLGLSHLDNKEVVYECCS